MYKIKPLKKKFITFTIAGFLFANPIFVQADLGDQVLKEGMNHEDVRVLQQHLINLNYLELEETTTYYGNQTIEAVMDFQSSKGLKADGTFGSDSFKALQNILQSVKSNKFSTIKNLAVENCEVFICADTAFFRP